MIQPHTSYFICATPRTGSALLCEALSATLIAGRPREYFVKTNGEDEKGKRIFFKSLLEKTLDRGTSPNGVFGIKIMWNQFVPLVGKLRKMQEDKTPDRSIPEVLCQVFPNMHYIWLTRRDKVRQAISLDKAVQTGIFHWTSNEPLILEKQPTFNFNRLNYLYYRISEHDEAWQGYFSTHRITPFKVVYEDLVEAYEETTKGILDYLKLPVQEDLRVENRKQMKMADALSEEWVRQYYAVKESSGEEASRIHRLMARAFVR